VSIRSKLRGVWPSLFAGAVVAAASSIAPAQVSLKTVVDLAQRNSVAVRLAQADVAKASAQLSESKDAIIPTVQFSTGIPVFPEVGFTGEPPSIFTTTVQTLIFGIPQKHFIDSARLGLQAASSRLIDAREQVALDASTAYIELDTVSRELEAARRQEGFAGRLVEIEEKRAEAGVDPLSELLQARLTAAEIKLRVQHLEGRERTVAKQLSTLTGLPFGSITTDHASIPEIPQFHGDFPPHTVEGVRSAQLLAHSRQLAAKAQQEINYLPQLSFDAQYNRNTTLLNDVNSFFAKPLPANNFSSGIAIQVPLLSMGQRARAREAGADALRATVEAEQAERQSDIQIFDLSNSIRELDTLAEIAALKQQIASDQLQTVLTQLELGNGAGSSPGAPPQLTPRAEQLARIEEIQKLDESMDAGLDLSKARLGLLRALGHMQDWLLLVHAR
jgi:outer membrane protein TolC